MLTVDSESLTSCHCHSNPSNKSSSTRVFDRELLCALDLNIEALEGFGGKRRCCVSTGNFFTSSTTRIFVMTSDYLCSRSLDIPFNVNLSLAFIVWFPPTWFVWSVLVGHPPFLQIYSSICSSVGWIWKQWDVATMYNNKSEKNYCTNVTSTLTHPYGIVSSSLQINVNVHSLVFVVIQK